MDGVQWLTGGSGAGSGGGGSSKDGSSGSGTGCSSGGDSESGGDCGCSDGGASGAGGSFPGAPVSGGVFPVSGAAGTSSLVASTSTDTASGIASGSTAVPFPGRGSPFCTVSPLPAAPSSGLGCGDLDAVLCFFCGAGDFAGSSALEGEALLTDSLFLGEAVFRVPLFRGADPSVEAFFLVIGHTKFRSCCIEYASRPYRCVSWFSTQMPSHPVPSMGAFQFKPFDQARKSCGLDFMVCRPR